MSGSQDNLKTHNLNGMLRLSSPIDSAISGFPVSLFSGFLQNFLVWEGFRLKPGFSIELSYIFRRRCSKVCLVFYFILFCQHEQTMTRSHHHV
jgi:hypothetical protein